jgi:thioredoxin 1
MPRAIATGKDFQKHVLESAVPVLVDFFAPWCGPCRLLSPLLERLEPELDGKARLVSVNVDEAGELAAQYGIMAVPTVLIFKNGQLTSRLLGLRKAEEFREALGLEQ